MGQAPGCHVHGDPIQKKKILAYYQALRRMGRQDGGADMLLKLHHGDAY